MLVVVYLFLLSALRAGLEFGSATLGIRAAVKPYALGLWCQGLSGWGRQSTCYLLVTVTKCVVVVLGGSH